MSLLAEGMELFTVINKSIESDGEGGQITVWRDGLQFQAAAVLDSSTEARIGEVQGLTAVYTIVTRKAINLQYHDVVRRERDSKIFRITSDGDDKATPAAASNIMDIREVTAEEWRLPGD